MQTIKNSFYCCLLIGLIGLMTACHSYSDRSYSTYQKDEGIAVSTDANDNATQSAAKSMPAPMDKMEVVEEEAPMHYGANKEIKANASMAKKRMASPPPPAGYIVPPPTDRAIQPVEQSREGYDAIVENDFLAVNEKPLSTFSIDVDGAAYSNMRRMITANQMPYPDAVRIEEMINYFNYDYKEPMGKTPFSIETEVGECPWNEDTQLLHIGLQGKKIDHSQMPLSNLVFLLDVSGSMGQPNKLPLVKKSLRMLIDQMRPDDRVALVVYAGAAGLVLPSTPFSDKKTILKAIENLQSGGSTAGGAGINLAYKVAQDNFIKNGNNRVILCTDGDFNVGVSNDGSLVRLIEEKRKTGVFLSIMGFGTGNYQDAKMEKISNAGNGNYSYIDNLKEAKKVLVSEMGGTLHTIAKDVKIQIEFNPNKVKAYRLIGYENRRLQDRDFNDDTKDAGELGVGHTVTALYEIVPTTSKMNVATTDALKYQTNDLSKEAFNSDEWLTVKFRYKAPDADKSKLITKAVTSAEVGKISDNLSFSAAVAYFGMMLRESKYLGNMGYSDIVKLAKQSKGKDTEGYRAEFIRLVETVKLMDTRAVAKR